LPDREEATIEWNKKFREELMAYFPFITYCILYDKKENYAVEMASVKIIYISDFMTITSGIQVTLRLVRQKFEGLQ
jgi:hypothetical protein